MGSSQSVLVAVRSAGPATDNEQYELAPLVVPRTSHCLLTTTWFLELLSFVALGRWEAPWQQQSCCRVYQFVTSVTTRML